MVTGMLAHEIERVVQIYARADPDVPAWDSRRDGVQQAIKSAGAAAISKLPPESYTTVWEQLLKLKDEVDADAAG